MLPGGIDGAGMDSKHLHYSPISGAGGLLYWFYSDFKSVLSETVKVSARVFCCQASFKNIDP